jgi:hypothetical protein
MFCQESIMKSSHLLGFVFFINVIVNVNVKEKINIYIRKKKQNFN